MHAYTAIRGGCHARTINPPARTPKRPNMVANRPLLPQATCPPSTTRSLCGTFPVALQTSSNVRSFDLPSGDPRNCIQCTARYLSCSSSLPRSAMGGICCSARSLPLAGSITASSVGRLAAGVARGKQPARLVMGANRPPPGGVECRLGSSIIKTASPKKARLVPCV